MATICDTCGDPVEDCDHTVYPDPLAAEKAAHMETRRKLEEYEKLLGSGPFVPQESYDRQAAQCVELEAEALSLKAERDEAQIKMAGAESRATLAEGRLGEAVILVEALAAEDCESFCGACDEAETCMPRRARATLASLKGGG
jgi:uncharacterized protein YciI